MSSELPSQPDNTAELLNITAAGMFADIYNGAKKSHNKAIVIGAVAAGAAVVGGAIYAGHKVRKSRKEQTQQEQPDEDI